MDYQIVLRICEERTKYRGYLESKIEGLQIVEDTDKNAMHTFLNALDFVGENAAVHIEDDIIVTAGFQSKLDCVIQDNSDTVIQFFSMRKDDLLIGSRLDYGRKFMMCQCFYLPPNYSKLLLEYHSKWEKKEQQLRSGYDLLIADFLKARKEKYWIHVPSLVDHRKVRSAINRRRSSFRQSKTFEL